MKKYTFLLALMALTLTGFQAHASSITINSCGKTIFARANLLQKMDERYCKGTLQVPADVKEKMIQKLESKAQRRLAADPRRLSFEKSCVQSGGQANGFYTDRTKFDLVRGMEDIYHPVTHEWLGFDFFCELDARARVALTCVCP